MKRLKLKSTWLLLIVVATTAVLEGCTKEQPVPASTGKGLVSLSFASQSGGRTTQPTATPATVFISIEGEQGNFVLEKRLSLFAFGSGYTTEKIQLETGAYQITGFLVLDYRDSVLYATPVKSSPTALRVNKPLPIDLPVASGQTTSLNVEVVSVKGQPASQFGYASFGFAIVEDACEFSTSINGKPWCATASYIIAFGNNPQLFLMNARSDTALFGIEFRATSTGTYTVFEDGYYFSKSKNRLYSIVSGSVTLSEVTSGSRASGTFQLTAVHQPSGDTVRLNNGAFQKIRGMGYW